jgi:hypothetical protein
MAAAILPRLTHFCPLMSRLSSNFVPNMSAWSPRNGVFAGIYLSLNWFAVAAFVCGATSPLVITVMGEIYVGELLIIQFALLLLLLVGARPVRSQPALGIFLQTAVIMLLGYFVSDIYRDAHPVQFLRGWAKIILVTLDFAALAFISAHDKRALWWFILGMALGGIGDSMVREVSIATLGGWKTGYSLPLVSMLACLCFFAPIKLAAVGFAVLGLVNIFMDYRILGAICVFVAAILWLRSTGTVRLSGWRLLRMFTVCVVAGGIVGGAMVFTQDEFSARREQSNVGRGAGLSVAVQAIAESPLVGYGSWPMDARLVNLYNQQFAESGGKSENRNKINAFHAHSQILQGWVEGGVMGALFWFYYGYWLIRAIWYVALRRQADAYLPVFLFFLTYDLWHLFMSVFSGPTRLPIAVGVAMICVCAAEMLDAREQKCQPL